MHAAIDVEAVAAIPKRLRRNRVFMRVVEGVRSSRRDSKETEAAKTVVSFGKFSSEAVAAIPKRLRRAACQVTPPLCSWKQSPRFQRD